MENETEQYIIKKYRDFETVEECIKWFKTLKIETLICNVVSYSDVKRLTSIFEWCKKEGIIKKDINCLVFMSACHFRVVGSTQVYSIETRLNEALKC